MYTIKLDSLLIRYKYLVYSYYNTLFILLLPIGIIIPKMNITIYSIII